MTPDTNLPDNGLKVHSYLGQTKDPLPITEILEPVIPTVIMFPDESPGVNLGVYRLENGSHIYPH